MAQSINIISEEDCTGCFACKSVCQKSAISLHVSTDGFLYPIVDNNSCTNCGACLSVCPAFNKVPVHVGNQKAYSFVHPNAEYLSKSTSGGAFSAIAEYFFSNNGVVYGAAFQEDWSVRHVRATNFTELAPMRGSKYLQSNNEDVYSLIKEDLKNGKLVLYTGTPCQVAGVVSFFDKNARKERLFTVDLICHGVNSPHFFSQYVHFLQNKYHGLLEQFEFRNKTTDWERPRVSFVIAGKKRKQLFNNNEFIAGFRKNILLRKACYQCNFTQINRCSDVTIGDYWGVPKNLKNKRGVSLVLTNTRKGSEVLASTSLGNHFVVQNVENVFNKNPQLSLPSQVRDKKLRLMFLKGVGSPEWDQLLHGKIFGGKFIYLKKFYYYLRELKRCLESHYG